MRPKDLGVSVLERSVTGIVHLSLYNKFPLFLHTDDEEQSNVKDSIRESRGNLYLNTWTYLNIANVLLFKASMTVI